LTTDSEPNPEIRYTDLHCHILPGLDDGARDWDEALSMAKQAVRGGAARMVATPHVMRGVYYTSPEDIRRAVSELRARLEDARIPLEVIPGSEIYLSSGVALEYRSGKLLPIGGSGFLLVELPSLYFPRYVLRELFELRLAGAGVILAHPERNRELCKKKGLIQELMETDVMFQLNAGSFNGVYGADARACAEYMLREGLVHFIGSDAHSGQHAATSNVGADIGEPLRRISRLSREGKGFWTSLEARATRLLAGKL
jgi:protein-tyrosine phosphatase